MATPGRQSHLQVVHFLRKTYSYTEGQTAVVTIGVLPAGAVIIGAMSGIAVTTAFNDATNKLCKIGVTGTDDKYDASASLATLGFVPFDAAASHLIGTTDTTVILTGLRTGTAASAGSAEIIIAYCPDTDG